jgi:hypothetical protein
MLLAGTTGCEGACKEDEETQGTTCIAKSLTRWEGSKFNGQSDTAWTSAKNVTVDGVFGKITVVAGTGDKVEVDYSPFSWRAHDGEADAVDDMENSLKTEVTTDASGNFLVRSFREAPYGSSLGTDMVVKLPAGFDARLTVNNRGSGDIGSKGEFDVDIDSVASATALDVRAGSNLGDCTVNGAPSVTSSEVHCGSLVKLFNVSDAVNASTSSGVGDGIELSLAGISANGGGTIEAENGDIVISLPSTGAYSVQATSSSDGTVTVGTPPAGCTVEGQDSRSQTLACGTGPNYTVRIAQDALDGSVTLNFR